MTTLTLKCGTLTPLAPRHPATFTLSHFHTFLYAEQPFEKSYPTFGQKYPVSFPFYPYFRPQKCRFSVGLKCKKWGARGDNNNLYICINFFLAFSLFKKRESVKVWKWTEFFTFFYFFSRKICKHHNSHRNFAAQFRKAPRRSRKPTTIRDFRRPRDEEALRNRWGGLEVTKVSSRVYHRTLIALSSHYHRTHGHE